MLEAIFEFIGELLVQLAVQVLVELGLESLMAPFQRAAHPAMAAIGYAMLGAIAGGVSLALFPASTLHGAWRALGLLLGPVAGGALMLALATRRMAQGTAVLGAQRFAHGYLFALSLALVRFWFARH